MKRFDKYLLSVLVLLASAAALAQTISEAPLTTVQSRPVQPGPIGQEGFSVLTPQVTGLLFTNLISEKRHLTNQILLNGSGVAAGDVDGDGWCDLYFCSIDGPNALYRNLGNWRFEAITERAGVACPNLDATGAVLADLDGDGDLDLVVNSVGGGTPVFANDGQGHFTQVAELNGTKGGMSAALGDLDGDGFLDLYLANYRTRALMDMPNARAEFKVVNGKNTIAKVNGRPMTAPDLTNRFIVGRFGVVEELGEPDALYRNIRGTNFVPVPFTGGTFLDAKGQPLTAPLFDWGLSVMVRDLNGDGLPDVYVCNDFETPDRLWLNQGNGRLQEAPALTMRKSSLFSMGVDFADVNRDGYEDFLVADMLNRDHQLRITQMQPLPPLPEEIAGIEGRPQYMHTTLFLNRGDGTYAEIAQLSGVEASDWSWLPIFLDVDLDGWEDLLISSGHERAARDLDVADQMKLLRRSRRNLTDAEIFQARRAFPRLPTGTMAFRNRGDLTFEDAGARWGFSYKGVAQGMALADLDNDGDLDVVINNSNDAAGVFRNNSAAARLAVRLHGLPPNTHGIGARIQVTGPGLPRQSQEMIAGGRYLSCDQAMRVFAAGAVTNRLRLEVRWRSGRLSVIEDALPNHLYQVQEAAARDSMRAGAAGAPPSVQEEGASIRPLFEDLSERLAHRHDDQEFNDFTRQPLLPNNLSQLGPGVTWCDLNGDGWEDLVVGAGKGGRLAVFTNDAQGGFARWGHPLLNQAAPRDLATVLGWQKASNQVTLLAGAANYEDGLTRAAPVRFYDFGRGRIDETLPGSSSSTGPLVLADVDGDGDLDLFVGGRAQAGKYPVPASSALYINSGGKFTADPNAGRVLAGIGLVSGAVCSDLDGNGTPELVLACDWGPLRVLRAGESGWMDVTDSLGMGAFTGWWNGVTAADFDGDGRLDLAASNWGRNTKYQSHRSEPLRVFYGDFNGDGSIQIVEAYWDPAMKKLVPERQLGPMAQAMAFLRGRFSSHRAYAEASVEEVLGPAFARAKSWQANWLESTVFLNRGDRFEARVLPLEAQMAPAFGICAGDWDGDGHEDLLLAQNFFAVQPETPRYDAGRGLVLLGDGQGGFRALAGQESGLGIYGEQRGAAACDYDHDGRLDVVIAQNRAETKLYHNVGGRAGLRVRLIGEKENPAAVGAVVRLIYGDRLGPARELHAGSGYWSQSAACQVFGGPQPPTGIWVRWPGGRETRSGLPKGARAVEVDVSGAGQQVD